MTMPALPARKILASLLGVAATWLATIAGLLIGRAAEPALAWPLALLAATAAGLLLIGWPLVRGLRSLDQIERDVERYANGEVDPLPRTPAARSMRSLAARLRALGVTLRARQESAEQSEELLHTIIDASPTAVLLFEDRGEIEYANDTARTLFFEGRNVEHENFLSMLVEAPAPFREAVLCDQDRLFSVSFEGSPETYHLSKRHFELHGATHTLLMVRHLTRELRRQEIDIWKKLVRVVSHELNNSLAPIKSLVHSARIMTNADHNPKLDRVFSTIDERASHLQGFVESYARFARLPSPRREQVNLAEFLAHIGTLAPYAHVTAPAPAAVASFDRSQLEQVIINLLKNAREAGGPEDAISLVVRADGEQGVTIIVADGGPGMSPEVLESAMLPFFSTKEGGSGLGLALCREIIEAHGGGIRLENRKGGGLAVTCTLPALSRPPTTPKARLTLSRV